MRRQTNRGEWWVNSCSPSRHYGLDSLVVDGSALPLHPQMNWMPQCPPRPTRQPLPPPPALMPPAGQTLPSPRKPSRSALPHSEQQSERHSDSLKSWAVQSQGCERGIREVAAAGEAEGLQPGAAPANLHHAFICNALETKPGSRVRRHQHTERGRQKHGVHCGSFSSVASS